MIYFLSFFHSKSLKFSVFYTYNISEFGLTTLQKAHVNGWLLRWVLYLLALDQQLCFLTTTYATGGGICSHGVLGVIFNCNMLAVPLSFHSKPYPVCEQGRKIDTILRIIIFKAMLCLIFVSFLQEPYFTSSISFFPLIAHLQVPLLSLYPVLPQVLLLRG